MLVRVPPGTVPGSTLHVRIPGGDSNRTIAAKVPPGVSEFYVEYDNIQPQSNNNMNGGGGGGLGGGRYGNNNNNNQCNYNQGGGRGGGGGRYNNNRPNNNNNNNNNNGQGRNSGAMGYVAPVLAGAALMGATGYMIHNHNQHNNDANNYNNDTNNYNDGNNYDDG